MMNRKTVFVCFNSCLVFSIVAFLITFWDFIVSFAALNAWFWAFIIIGIFLEIQFYRWTKGGFFLGDLRNQKIFFVYYFQALTEIVTGIINWHDVDFYLVFIKGVQLFIAHPSQLFTGNLYMECRRVPGIMLYYMIFNSIPFPINFVAQSLVTLYCNLGSCYVIFQICKLKKIKESQIPSFIKSPYVIAGIYIVYFGFFFEYLVGDSYSLAGFFVIAGLYYFLQGKEHAGFFFWGLSIMFILNTIIWVFFLILKKPLKQFVKNAVFLIIPLLPTIIMLLLWPNLIWDFIPCNIKFSQGPLANMNISGTFSSNLASIFGINILYPFLISIIVVVPFTIFTIYKTPLVFIDKLMIAALATISIIPDFDAGHVVYFMVPYLFWLSMKSKDISIKIKMIPFIPTTIMAIWFVFPLMSVFYIVPLILIEISLIKKSLNAKKGMIQPPDITTEQEMPC